MAVYTCTQMVKMVNVTNSLKGQYFNNVKLFLTNSTLIALVTSDDIAMLYYHQLLGQSLYLQNLVKFQYE